MKNVALIIQEVKYIFSKKRIVQISGKKSPVAIIK
jgi:hypothetical protein